MVDDMRLRFNHGFENEGGAFAKARELFEDNLQAWFKTFGDRVSWNNNFLRINPLKVFWCKASTRVERTADLLVKAEATSTPHAYPVGKILTRRAVEFSCEWPNAD